MSDKAHITPAILKWARESAKMTIEIAASKVSTSIEKLEEWEEGVSQPTIKQAQNLAKAYKRPFALFFLPDIPRDFQPLQDFRNKDAKPLSTASIFIIREIQQKQAWISSLNEDLDSTKTSFVGRFTIDDDPIIVAIDILQTLGIDPSNYKYENPLREWIEKAESNGVFVSRTSFIHSRLKLDSDEFQGFAIADQYAPFVFINSDDWNAPQLFTLVHELAHIWIAASGISNDTEPGSIKKDKLHPVELFCNEVAANALMPTEIINKFPSSTYSTFKDVFAKARTLGVSTFAFLFRAYKLNLINLTGYRELKQIADSEYEAFLEREEVRMAKQRSTKYGPSYYLLQLNKNSRLFTQTVLDAFRGGLIEPTQASSLLNVQVNKFNKLEAQLYK